MRMIYDTELRDWSGNDQQFPTGLEFALAAEGLKQRELLIRAGYKSLRSWVDCQISDIGTGLREAPTGPCIDTSHLEESRKAKAADRRLGFV